jgi:hypothetical protein
MRPQILAIVTALTTGCTSLVSGVPLSGYFEGCLCNGEPANHVELVDETSSLSLEFTGRTENSISAQMRFDGELIIYGFTLVSDGHEVFNVDLSRIDDSEFMGAVKVEGQPALKLHGTLGPQGKQMYLRARHVGVLWLQLHGDEVMDEDEVVDGDDD